MNQSDREIFIHRIADQALTDLLSVQEWCKYYDRSWHKTKAILEHTEGVVKFETLYRIPLKSAPPAYLKKINFYLGGSHNPSKSEVQSI